MKNFPRPGTFGPFFTSIGEQAGDLGGFKRTLRNDASTMQFGNVLFTLVCYGSSVSWSRYHQGRCPEKEGSVDVNMQEVARPLLGLRAAGWTEKEINDFLLYIETGEEQYKPNPSK